MELCSAHISVESLKEKWQCSFFPGFLKMKVLKPLEMPGVTFLERFILLLYFKIDLG